MSQAGFGLFAGYGMVGSRNPPRDHTPPPADRPSLPPPRPTAGRLLLGSKRLQTPTRTLDTRGWPPSSTPAPAGARLERGGEVGNRLASGGRGTRAGRRTRTSKAG